MKALFLVFAGLTSISTTSEAFSWGDDCEYSREIKREVSIDEATLLKVDAGAGKLEVKGDDSLKTVLINAKLCAGSESQLADMDVVSELKDDAAYFDTVLAKGKLWNTGNDGSYIDLTLHVPKGANLDVTDSSGQASVDGVASLEMVDSSGSLVIENIGGNVRVEDSSGSLTIEEVSGSVWVTDSSGSIEVRDVKGDFTVNVDSSGSIEAERIVGNVLVRTDSSGSINVTEVGGDFTVGQDSSGGIYHKNVNGEVNIPN